MKKKIPIPKSGGLTLSYKCSAKCLHCMYGCSPQWSADWISHDDLRAVLSQLARTIAPSPYGPNHMGLNHGLHFTGGEPFLNFELLCAAVEIANDLRIPSLFVETNCFWCKDDRVTESKLRALKEKGLIGIMISVNPFYLEYVPFERTERCITASLDVFGPNVAVYQHDYYRRFKAWGISGRMPIEEYFQLEREADVFQHVEFFLNGRAVYGLASKWGGMLSRYIRRFSPELFFSQPCAPSFVRSWHNHFDNYGNYVPGYCGGISYGDCRRLHALLADGIETEEFPVLSLLMDEDLQGLFTLATERGYREHPDGYFSRCHLCLDIRKHLADTGEYKELVPVEFYRHLED